ncbi:MAG TPA: hypothetical protein VLA88_05070 [Candidatus Saccharimonadales bacterium]|nr:hypothetical protein [Candidatus Saccharimonadales bacterium]
MAVAPTIVRNSSGDVLITVLAEAPLQHHRPFGFSVDFFSVGIPLILAFGMPVVAWMLRKIRRTGEGPLTDIWMPFLAGIAWYWAIQLPNVPVTGRSESTLMHFIGGAIVAPSLYFYLMRAFGLTTSRRILIRIVSFYSFTFVLFGCGNELMEYLMVRFLHSKIELADMVPDLVTDFTGNTAALVAIELARRRKTRQRHQEVTPCAVL